MGATRWRHLFRRKAIPELRPRPKFQKPSSNLSLFSRLRHHVTEQNHTCCFSAVFYAKLFTATDLDGITNSV